MKQLALGRPLRRTWQEGGTETRDVSTISTGPQATVGKIYIVLHSVGNLGLLLKVRRGGFSRLGGALANVIYIY